MLTSEIIYVIFGIIKIQKQYQKGNYNQLCVKNVIVCIKYNNKYKIFNFSEIIFMNYVQHNQWRILGGCPPPPQTKKKFNF